MSKRIKVRDEIYIFGAHSRAQTLGVYLTSLYPGTRVKAYLVNNDEENPSAVGDTEVIDIRKECLLDTSLPVYIGTRGIYHNAIKEKLSIMGFTEIVPVTVDMDVYLRNRYVSMVFSKEGRDFKKIDDIEKKKIKIFNLCGWQCL